MKFYTVDEIIIAHQYLYYIEATPIWSDRDYDFFCNDRNIEGGGGSDLASSYPKYIVELAHKMKANPKVFSYEKLDELFPVEGKDSVENS